MDSTSQAGVIRGPTNNLALKVLAGTAPVVTLIGETGVGKTFLAKNIGKRRIFDYLSGDGWWSGIPRWIDKGERVVACMDVVPQHSLELPHAIASRLMAGLVARVGEFTAVMKLELLNREGIPGFARGVILKSIQGGVRELLGAVQLVQQAEPQPENALDVMRLISPFSDIHSHKTFEDVATAVCMVYHLTPEALGSKCRKRHVSEARKAFWWVCSKLCPAMTVEEIAKATGSVGGNPAMDHSTIVIGIREAEKRGLTKSERFSMVLSFLGEDANDHW